MAAHTFTLDRYLDSLSLEELYTLKYTWSFWARAKQLPPEKTSWRTWLILAGRGWGKTRTGAEFIRSQIENGKAGRIALVGETWADVRDVMIEGESGILSICPPWNRPVFETSKKRLTWPNGAQAFAFSAHEPDQLRGPQFDCAWADEIAKYPTPESWDQLMFALRLGEDPKCIATTTPRPQKWLKKLAENEDTYLVTGSTHENAANLAAAFLSEILDKYEGTRLGRQEIEARFLEDTEGALWTRSMLEKITIGHLPELDRVVVAVDPAVSAGSQSDNTGIIVVGKKDNQGFVLADYSVKAAPLVWARRAVEAYHHFKADRIIAEANQGGDLVESMIRTVDPSIAYKSVHATRGKLVRAEPIAALYEQGRVFHCTHLSDLEDEMCTYNGTGKSPDRLDALVWGLTHLLVKPVYRAGMMPTTGW